MSNCKGCGREYNPCAMRTCPKDSRAVCIYCCRKCPEMYRADTMEGCRLADRLPNVKKRKGKRNESEITG